MDAMIFMPERGQLYLRNATILVELPNGDRLLRVGQRTEWREGPERDVLRLTREAPP